MSPNALTPADVIRDAAHPLRATGEDYSPLLRWIGEARIVLLSTPSYGTHEFHKARSAITKRLIAEHGFTAIAVEADWPDAYRVNRFVRGDGEDNEAVDALTGFQRFPAWTWRNADFLDFVGWLKNYTEGRPYSAQAGFYGLDLFNLQAAQEAALRHLEAKNPLAAHHLRENLTALEHLPPTDSLAPSLEIEITPSCEEELVNLLVELRHQQLETSLPHESAERDRQLFFPENAPLVTEATDFYHYLFQDRMVSWNIRNRQMADTLDLLSRHLQRNSPPKIVVWAHSNYLGDARANDLLVEGGAINLGQLIRERHSAEVRLVGFSTYSGTVTAASHWENPAERLSLAPAIPGSVESLFHETGIPRFALNLQEEGEAVEILQEPLLQRAIGVTYHPETELDSHYALVRLADQYDAILHFDETRAVEAMERMPR